MKSETLGIIIILALLAAGFIFYASQSIGPVVGGPTTSGHSYRNETYGLSFIYPEDYVLTEREVGDAHRGHYAITIVRDVDAMLPENGEGPTSITIDIYQNNLEQQALLDWLTGSNLSNYKLGDGSYTTTIVDGKDAVRYRWSGLYEGETTAFRHAGNIIAISVTRLTPEDEQIAVYESLINSLDLENPRPLSRENAVSYVQGMYADLQGYPSNNLPPKRIDTQQTDGGWYVAFITEGSGVRGILEAKCFYISHAKEVRQTGTYTANGQPAENLNYEACSPMQPS